jgi:hypothetical protein
MLQAIGTSRVWVGAIGAMAYVVSALFAVGAIAATVGVRNLHVRSAATVAPLFACIVMAGTTAFVGLRLSEYARALRDVVEQPSGFSMEQAAQRARTLWLTAGIVAIVWTIATVVGGAIGIAGATRTPPASFLAGGAALEPRRD